MPAAAPGRAPSSLGLGALIALLSVAPARPQANDQNRTVTVDYAYAAQIGIGGYDLAGLSVNIFTLPLVTTLDVGPSKAWQLKLKAPINVGVHDFAATDTDGTRISLHQQTLTLIPGLDLQIPVTEQWRLNPLANFGLGWVLQSGASAYIYSAGVKSALTLQHEPVRLTLGNAVAAAGDAALGGHDREDYVAIETGLELRRRLGIEFAGLVPDLGLYAIDYYYPKALVFTRFLQAPLRVSNQFEVGLTLGSAEPFTVCTFRNPRLGIGYVFGGGLSVIRARFGFPF